MVPVAQTSNPIRIPRLYPKSLHQPSGGKCRQKISTEKRHLDQRRLRVRQPERFLQMLDQHVIQVDPNRPHKKQAGHQDQRHHVAAFSDRSRFRHSDFSSQLRQRAIQVYVPAIHEQMLPGRVARFRRQQKHHHRRNLFRGGHSFFQRNL